MAYEFKAITPRIQEYNHRIRNRSVRVSAERHKIATEAWKKYVNMPPILKISSVTLESCKQVSVHIEPNEVIVGTIGDSFCSIGNNPMWSGPYWILGDIEAGRWELDDEGVYHSPGNFGVFPVSMSKEDYEIFQETKDYWLAEQHTLTAMGDTFQPYGFEEYQAVACSDYAPGRPLICCPPGHLTAGFKKIVDVGYGAIKKQADDWIAERKGNLMGEDMEKYLFYKAASISCEAATTLISRYAEEAARQAAECTDPERKAELEQMADSIAWIATNPARTFWEAVQATIFYQVLLNIDQNSSPSCSFGRFDQYTWPYLEKQLEEGSITLDEAQEIVDAFFLKANSFSSIVPPFLATTAGAGVTYQHTTIGGVDPDTGEDSSNPVTYMVLESICRLELHDPPISLRINKNTPHELWELALTTSKLIGGLPLFQNDDVIIPALQEEMGFSLHDARDFSLIGCQEIVGSGCDYPACSSPAPPHVSVWFGVLMDMAINNGINPKTGVQCPDVQCGYLYEMESFDEVLAAYEAYTRWAMRWQITMGNYSEYIQALVAPQVMTSISMADCMEVGKDATQGGCRYNSYGGSAPGLATVADSLTTIKYMCFDKKLCTTRELYDAVMANWEGYEELRQQILAVVPHYGNNDPYADEMLKWVIDLYVDCCGEGYSTRCEHFKAGLYGASDHIAQGMQTWATPDGRRDGDPLADAASPAQGRDKNGPTAVFNSVCCYDHSKFIDGMALNLRLHPNVLSSQDGYDKMEAMTRAYFDNGGMEVQYNIVSTDTLRKAKEDPDSYRNLVVRIAGFSAYFVEMNEALQDDIISRTEGQLG